MASSPFLGSLWPWVIPMTNDTKRFAKLFFEIDRVQHELDALSEVVREFVSQLMDAGLIK